jgi:hypothetical protein
VLDAKSTIAATLKLPYEAFDRSDKASKTDEIHLSLLRNSREKNVKNTKYGFKKILNILYIQP